MFHFWTAYRIALVEVIVLVGWHPKRLKQNPPNPQLTYSTIFEEKDVRVDQDL